MELNRELYGRAKQLSKQGYSLSQRRDIITSIEDVLSLFPNTADNMRPDLYEPRDDLKEFLLFGHKANRFVDYITGAACMGISLLFADLSLGAYNNESYGFMAASALVSLYVGNSVLNIVGRTLRSAKMQEQLEEREF